MSQASLHVVGIGNAIVDVIAHADDAFIETNGLEKGAMTLIDACVRLLPGVMGKLASGTEESFSEGLLEYPQYTRPQEFEGRQIPEILVSGDHAKVAAWRLAQSEALTAARRPDLWARRAGQKAAPRRTKNTTDG